MKLQATAMIAACVGLTACVSNSRYNTAVKAAEEQRAEREKAVQEMTATEERLRQTEEKLVTTARDRGQLKSTLEDMKKAMAEMRERQAEERKRLQEFQDLTQRFKKLTDSGTLSVKIIDGKMVVSLGSDVLFGSGSAKLSAAGTDAVKEVTTQLASIPGKRYQIEGHTDNVPIATATFPSNWELASARALTVLKAMVDGGMPADRVSAASYGDTQPVKPNDTVEGKAANRRIAIVVVPDLSSLPGYEELQKLSTK